MGKETHNELFMYVDKIKAALRQEHGAWHEQAEAIRDIRDWFKNQDKATIKRLALNAGAGHLGNYGWVVFFEKRRSRIWGTK